MTTSAMLLLLLWWAIHNDNEPDNPGTTVGIGVDGTRLLVVGRARRGLRVVGPKCCGCAHDLLRPKTRNASWLLCLKPTRAS